MANVPSSILCLIITAVISELYINDNIELYYSSLFTNYLEVK